jgi:hypothetical protein
VNNSVRWLLTVLLALSLPLQGFAATSMLLCGPLHQGSMQPMQPHHAAADTSSAHAKHHGDRAAAAEQVDQDSIAKVYGQCSLCAACCAALALTPHVPVLHAARAGDRYAPVQFEPAAGFLTGGIERPPRLFFA